MKIKKLKEEYLCEMARVGWIPSTSKNTIEVDVRTDDSGNIPHFYVRKYGRDNSPEWETCIKFESAEYFIHGKYTHKLPSKLCKDLDNMLREPNPKSRNLTFWETAIDAWNQNNSSIDVSIDLKQPNYSELK